MNLRNIILPVSFLIIGLIIGAAALYILMPEKSGVVSTDNPSVTNVNPSALQSAKLGQFSSYNELKNFLKIKSGDNSQGYSNSNMLSKSLSAESMAADASGGTAPQSPSASSYSHTNIQVEGVDEPDIVKNDGKYIYTVSGENVVIANAYPTDNMEISSKIQIKGVRDLFINKDKLIVFSEINDYIPYSNVRCLGLEYCGGTSASSSFVNIYDVSDKKNPKLVQNISIEGNYNSARMIGDYVYLISTKPVYNDEPVFPLCKVNGREIDFGISDLYYAPYHDSSYVFTSVSSINTQKEEFSNKMFLTGYTSTIYASENNIYITSMDYMDYEKYEEEIVKMAILPIVSDDIKSRINDVLGSDISGYKKFDEAGKIVEEYYNSLPEAERQSFNSTLMDHVKDARIELEKQRYKTVVYKVSIDKDKVDFIGKGEVPGRVLNQFSMDEHDGTLRIATTTGNQWWWFGERINSTNNLYVLDEDLNQAGSVEDMAPGETIYSVRFVGDRAYMVTYRQVDPLFVIDLSTTQPKVLGYLKVTGVSDYLHPYDENHIIGIGKDATEDGRFMGMKISLFDVSDVTNPKEISKVIIGDRGTSSEALYDHKAFLFDKDKNLLVIPVTLYELDKSKPINEWSYGELTWQGAYVFNIDLSGITEKGKITHYSEYVAKYGAAENDPIGYVRMINGEEWKKVKENSWKSQGSRYYNDWGVSDDDIDRMKGGINYESYLYDYEYTIKRSLYMDDTLYTISPSTIMANDLNTIQEINAVDLGYESGQYNYYY
jgi:inhibitor of cysteine peptidase